MLGWQFFVPMIGGMIILPLYMPNMAGFTATQSGLMLLPCAIIMGLMSPLTGRIFDRFGAKWLAVIGFALLTGTSVLFTMLTPDTSFAYLASVNAVRMFGTAMVIMPVTTAALNQLPQRMIPHGAALNNTMRQVAASIGTAVLVTVMTGTALDPAIHGAEGLIQGVNISFIVATAISIRLVSSGALSSAIHGQSPPMIRQTSSKPLRTNHPRWASTAKKYPGTRVITRIPGWLPLQRDRADYRI